MTVSHFAVILRYAGKDATEAYAEVHASSVISNELVGDKLMGMLDQSTVKDDFSQPRLAGRKARRRDGKPPLVSLINADDFEHVASQTLPAKTWAFHSSAATDSITKEANTRIFQQITLRPRMMRDVSQVDTTTTVLGCDTDVPFFVAPTAMAKLVHPEGEKAMARACTSVNMIHSISTNASFPMEEIVQGDGVGPAQPFFFQLYVNKDRRKSEALLAHLRALKKIRALLVTIDAPVPGKREADEKAKAEEGLTTPMSGARAKSDKKGGGYGRIMGGFVDASLSWDDVAWLKRHWTGPIVLKGVMTAMDARLAAAHGLDGIIVSNHGGRNLDTAPAAMLVLLELQRCCPEVFASLQVLVDGGIRRGTDIFKALCLGAKAVGIGRGFLYALNYGEEGVEALAASKSHTYIHTHTHTHIYIYIPPPPSPNPKRDGGGEPSIHPSF